MKLGIQNCEDSFISHSLPARSSHPYRSPLYAKPRPHCCSSLPSHPQNDPLDHTGRSDASAALPLAPIERIAPHPSSAARLPPARRCRCSKHREIPFTDAQMMPRTLSLTQIAHRTVTPITQYNQLVACHICHSQISTTL